MDIPEMNIVRKGLKVTRTDAAAALAVLLKTLADDHLATARPRDDDGQPIEPTLLESVHRLLKSGATKNGRLSCIRDANGVIHELPGRAAQVAGDVMVVQDALRDIVAHCLDLLELYNPENHEEAA